MAEENKNKLRERESNVSAYHLFLILILLLLSEDLLLSIYNLLNAKPETEIEVPDKKTEKKGG